MVSHGESSWLVLREGSHGYPVMLHVAPDLETWMNCRDKYESVVLNVWMGDGSRMYRMGG